MASTWIERIEQSAEAVKDKLGAIPECLVVAGSGLSGYAETLGDRVVVPYGEIPNFPRSSVVGHAGTLVAGRAGAEADAPRVLVMNGRSHLYEGHDAQTATLPLRALLRAGVKTVLLSNAAGGLNRAFDVGDIMLIADHVNLQFQNPLIGGNLDTLGPRFPDMSAAWDPGLRAMARRAARECGVLLREGVYIGGTGPSYETPAEVRMLSVWGDVVGMSTVPENLVAVHAGARCLGLSVVTNSLVLGTGEKTTHEEVLVAGRRAADTFRRLVDRLVRILADE